MAYRKQWYTYGIRNTASINSLSASDLVEGDTVYNTDISKPEYLINRPGIGHGKIWTNEDCILVVDWNYTTSPAEVGNVVQIALGFGGSAGNDNIWVIKSGTGVARYAGQYLGVVQRISAEDVANVNASRSVAIQGIYDVKFTTATTFVTAGNYAVISATAGEAAQGSSTAMTGVIGVIMETKTLGVDRLAKVMLQTFSSR